VTCEEAPGQGFSHGRVFAPLDLFACPPVLVWLYGVRSVRGHSIHPLSLLLIVWAVQGEEALGRGLFAVWDVVFPHFGFLRAYRFSLFV